MEPNTYPSIFTLFQKFYMYNFRKKISLSGKKGIHSDSEEKVFLILLSCFIYYCQRVMAMNPGSISGLFIQVIPVITKVILS